jgi:glycosyltransferase involved in cell wall biosynthesis
MKPLVSVILPFFNSERFLEEAIRSVIHQTWGHWELLLIDDGSRDNSTRIAKEFSRNEPARVIYLEHESHQNRGVCVSRNLGISKAKGEFIAFLDSDDVWLTDKLQQQMEIMQRIPEAGMVYGPALYWSSWNTKSTDQIDLLQPLGVESEKLYNAPSLLFLIDPLGKGSSACPSNILMRRDALESVGGFEEEFTGTHQAYEDQAFGMKVLSKENVFVSGSCWIKYRKHDDSCLSVVRKTGRNREAHLFFLKWVEDFLRNEVPESSSAWASFERAKWPYQHPFLAGIKQAPLKLMKWFAHRILGPEDYHSVRRKIKGVSK